MQPAVAGLTAAVQMCGKDFDDWDFTFKGYVGTFDPHNPPLLEAARQSQTAFGIDLTTFSRSSPRQEKSSDTSSLTDSCALSFCTVTKNLVGKLREKGGNRAEIRAEDKSLTRFTVSPDGRAPYQ